MASVVYGIGSVKPQVADGVTLDFTDLPSLLAAADGFSSICHSARLNAFIHCELHVITAVLNAKKKTTLFPLNMFTHVCWTICIAAEADQEA